MFSGQATQHTYGFATQVCSLAQRRIELLNRQAGGMQQLPHQGVALGLTVWGVKGVARLTCRRFAAGSTLFNFTQAVVQGVHQHLTTLGVVKQVILQIRVALHHPNVAQHLVKHARRTPGSALLPQLVQYLPGTSSEQANHNFSV